MDETPWAVAAAGLMAAAPQAQESRPESDERSLLGIDHEAFLKLLIAQIRHQDPLSPMDSGEFLSQLAELTTLEQMWRMNESLQVFMSQQQLLQASAMIGRTVQGTDDTDQPFQGVVQGALVRDGTVTLDLGDRQVPLKWVTSVR